MRGAFAHLGHRAGRAAELVGVHGLDGVNHHHRRLHGVHRGEDFFQLNFCQQVDQAAINAQPARTQRDLGATFFTRDIQRGQACALQRIHGLQQQRGFADAGVAANEHHTAFDHAAAKHAVQLLNTAGRTCHILRFNGVQWGDGLGVGHARIALWCAEAVLAARRRLRHAFDQAVPGAAAGALAQPARRGAATFIAGVDGFLFGHGVTISAQPGCCEHLQWPWRHLSKAERLALVLTGFQIQKYLKTLSIQRKKLSFFICAALLLRHSPWARVLPLHTSAHSPQCLRRQPLRRSTAWRRSWATCPTARPRCPDPRRARV